MKILAQFHSISFSSVNFLILIPCRAKEVQEVQVEVVVLIYNMVLHMHAFFTWNIIVQDINFHFKMTNLMAEPNIKHMF